MKPITNEDIDTALTRAEQSCFDKVCELLGVQAGKNAFISVNGGTTDCVVFDIGYPETGEVLGFPAEHFHFRGTLEMYNRSRKQLQKWTMRLMTAMPIATTQSTNEKMPDNTNVTGFRIAPITGAIAPISTTQLKYAAGDKGIETFTTTVTFDILFTVGSREAIEQHNG